MTTAPTNFQAEMDATTPNGSVSLRPAVKTKEQENKEKLGEDIAFGLQQTLVCFATDFIDPILGEKFQEWAQPEHTLPKPKYKWQEHPILQKHTWAGEIIGDSVAIFMFLAARKWAPQPIEWLKSGAATTLDSFFERSGKKSLESWAARHGLDENSERYQAKLSAYKDFQAENFAKSSVVAGSSIAANVVTQKVLGNQRGWSTITGAKIMGAAITFAGMLGLRTAVPKATETLDKELDERYFTPLIRKTQKMFGAEVTIDKHKHPAEFMLDDDVPTPQVQTANVTGMVEKLDQRKADAQGKWAAATKVDVSAALAVGK